MLRSPRRGRAFLVAAVVSGLLSVASMFTAEPDARLVVLPVATLLWVGQWLLTRHNGVVVGPAWVDVRNNGLRTQRVRWSDVISADPEPWLLGYRLRLWTVDAVVRTPSLSPDGLALVLARLEASRR